MGSLLRGIACVVIVLVPWTVLADPGLQKIAQDYASSLQTTRKPALVSICRTERGKSILILTTDGKPGQLFEFSKEEVENMADILVNKKGQMYFEEAQGGIYTYAVLQHRIEDLEKLPFRFVPPSKAGEILGMTSKAFCKDRPPEYK